MKIATILMAGGKGTRMRSNLPKVLHSLAGQPLIWHILQVVATISEEQPVVIVGHQAETVQAVIGEQARFVIQAQQLGTGHAVRQAEDLLREQSDLVLVLPGDMPLITPATLQKLVDAQKKNTGPISMLTVLADNPRGFGRIVRNERGSVMEIVEESEASPEQLKIKELNAGMYCFEADWLWNNLNNIPLSSKGEYYITDMVGIANQQDLPVKALLIDDVQEAQGINTRVHLAEAETALRQRTNHKWMLAGVTLIDPLTIYIEAGVTIGQDSVLYPNTTLQGDTRIGTGCKIGPHALIRDSQIGNDCQIVYSVVEQAKTEDHVDIGPFAHLRKGAHLANGVHMGNFGEVKNAYLGPGVKMGHFSYIGDATLGENVNIGAGTITCNYDGKNKNHTEIGANTFIGSDTMLVAPLKIGKNATTGAGSVVTKDVKDNTVVVGSPARAIRKKEKGE